jgi:hypothetical protein
MNYLVKLTDNDANTVTFNVDTYEELESNQDSNTRTVTGDLKHYSKTDKKKFLLGFKNMPAATKDLLKTIYDTHGQYDFYREADGAVTAAVVWESDFDLHTPVNNSRQFIDLIYQGTITLEEV